MLNNQKKSVVIVYGGWSHEAALSGYPMIHKAVQELGLNSTLIDMTSPHFVQELLQAKPFIVFPASHGAFHEDGKLQGLLEILDMPYVGSGVAASGVGMNKLISKLFFSGCGFKTAPYELVTDTHIPTYKDVSARLGSTLVLKPVSSGASFGVHLVKNVNEYNNILPSLVNEFHDILVEKFIDGGGREFSISVISTAAGVEVLPVCEIRTGSAIFDYNVKFTTALIEEKIPADISADLNKRLADVGKCVFQQLGCSSFARIDAIVDANQDIYILEINTLPGLLPTSIFPKACAVAGIPYTKMINLLIDSALIRKPMEIEKQYVQKELPEDIKNAMSN